MNREPVVDLDLVVAEVSDNVESAKADLKVSDPEDGEAVLQKLITEAKPK